MNLIWHFIKINFVERWKKKPPLKRPNGWATDGSIRTFQRIVNGKEK